MGYEKVGVEIVFSHPPEIDNHHLIALRGGLRSAPSWTEYKKIFQNHTKSRFNKDSWPHLIAIKAKVIACGLLNKTASEVANHIMFLTSDGYLYRYTWRAWGDLIQAIHNKREGYMTYY